MQVLDAWESAMGAVSLSIAQTEILFSSPSYYLTKA